MSALLACHDLSFSWPDGKGVRGIDLTLEAGSLTALIGRNGSGKSTLISLLMGMLEPDGGRIEAFGRSIQPGKDVGYKARIGYCPSEGGLLEDLSLRENFELVSWLRGKKKGLWKAQGEWVSKLGLEPLLESRAEALSSGQRRRAMIAGALIADPEVLILDEPGNDLDIEGLFILRELLAVLARDRAVLVSTHIIDVVRHAGGRVVFLEAGQKVHEGPLESGTGLEDLYRQIIWARE